MAQNFRRYTLNNVGTTPAGAPGDSTTFDSYDTVVGINLANITTSTVNASVYINDGTNNVFILKDAPIPVGGALQVLDGGAKIVVQSGDTMYVYSDTADSVDAWISVVDAIST